MTEKASRQREVGRRGMVRFEDESTDTEGELT